VLIHWDRQALPDQFDLFRNDLELQHVADVDRDHKGHQFMVSIRPPADDLKPEIEFGRSPRSENSIFQW
jgi:hypothetical protein